MALSYNDPGRILTDGPPSARRVDRVAVSLQDQFLSMASSPLQRTSPEAGFRGGGHMATISLLRKSTFYVRSDPSEWSHSWAMRKAKNNPKNNNQLLIREFFGIHNIVTNLMRATNYLGYFVYFVALGFLVIV